MCKDETLYILRYNASGLVNDRSFSFPNKADLNDRLSNAIFVLNSVRVDVVYHFSR